MLLTSFCIRILIAYRDGVWLHATVVYEAATPVLTFSANPPAVWNADLAARTVAHFDRLRLATLYSIHGTAEVPMIRSRLEILLERGGPHAVRNIFKEEADSRQAQEPNSWRPLTNGASRRPIVLEWRVRDHNRCWLHSAAEMPAGV